jgi:predicted unusual protein kinase regulating ubiquinone biosynthesis (AarF/ABC1/UbiB family)
MRRETGGAPTPTFAALRELARVYRECLQQAFFVWPARYSGRLLFDSSLDSAWKKDRFSEIFDQCLHGLKAELGPAYQNLFSSAGMDADLSVHAAAPVPFKEITDALDIYIPEWSHELILDKKPLQSTALFQIHAAVDERGDQWNVKVIKISARKKLESTLHALKEIEKAIRPFRSIPKAQTFLSQIEDLRRSLGRAVDLNLERRTLLRAKSRHEGDRKFTLRFPKIHERFNSDSVFVYEAIAGQTIAADRFHVDILEASKKMQLAPRPLQATVLKAFELGLIRNHHDVQKLVVMKDGTIGVSQGWSSLMADGKDRGQAANLLRALYVNDISVIHEVIEGGTARAHSVKNDHGLSLSLQERLRELSHSGIRTNFVDRAQATVHYTQSLGIELPPGFIDTARSLQALEGVGKPLVAHRVSVPFLGAGARALAAPDVAFYSHQPKARRLHRR